MDVYDAKGRLLDEPEEPAPTQALLDQMTAQLILQRRFYERELTRLSDENERLELGAEVDGRALAKLHQENAALRTVLLQLKTGGREGCWCAFAIGHPQYSDHTPVCKDIRALLGDDA